MEMRRKVNLVGQSTLTISLPSSWASDAGIKKGDELDIVIDSKERIVVSTKPIPQYRKIEIDVSDFGTMTGRLVGALYKAGYDEMILKFNDPKFISLIEKELSKGFIGLDILHQTKDMVHIKSMATLRAEEFDGSLRRVFRLVIENANESLAALAKQEWGELSLIAAKDVNVNKYADVCRRLLSKYGYPEYKKTPSIYFVTESLEKIGDMYRDLSNCAARRRPKVSKEALRAFKRTNELLVKLYELYYTFSPQRAENLRLSYVELKESLDSLHRSSSNDARLLAWFQNISTTVFDLNGAIICKNYI
jgi:phosphate uptake regulator